MSTLRFLIFTMCLAIGAQPAATQTTAPVEIQIHADHVAAGVSPSLYGLMTEEINFSYDGGLYAELVRNRSFKEDASQPVHWSLIQEHGGAATMALDPETPLNEAIATSLKVTVTSASGGQRAGIANEGFWGIPVRPNMRYSVSFFAKASGGFTGPLTISLVSNDGATVHASAEIPHISAQWQKYQTALTTKAGLAPSAANRLAITSNHPGTIWFSMVSLFPPTFNHRPNGNRPDIMQLLADMKPSFLLSRGQLPRRQHHCDPLRLEEND